MKTNVELENALKVIDGINAKYEVASPLIKLSCDLTEVSVDFFTKGNYELANKLLTLANELMDIANKSTSDK